MSQVLPPRCLCSPQVCQDTCKTCLHGASTQKISNAEVSMLPTGESNVHCSIKRSTTGSKMLCWFESIANGLPCADRVQHALMCVGMKLPVEADFVVCFIFQKASRALRCVRPLLSCTLCRLLCHSSFSLQSKKRTRTRTCN